MRYQQLNIFLYIILYLITVETVLEYRAYGRGFDTLFFGKVDVKQSSNFKNIYGPTSTFPFRSIIVDQSKPTNAIRLWFSSASHAEDIYQPADVIFPNKTCEILLKFGQNCQTLNDSRAGIGIVDNTRSLNNDANKWQVDFAILYQMKIDIDDLSKIIPTDSRKTGSKHTVNNSPIIVSSIFNFSIAEFLNRLVEKTTIYAHLSQYVKSRIKLAKQLLDYLPNSSHAVFMQRVAAYVTSCKKAGITPILTTFASMYNSSNLASFSDEIARSLLRYNDKLSKRGWTYSISSLNQAIREYANKENILLIDLEQALNGREYLFRDFSHFTSDGHRVVAETIATTIYSYLQKKAL